MSYSQIFATVDSALDRMEIKGRIYNDEEGMVRFTNGLNVPGVKFTTFGLIVHEDRIRLISKYPLNVDDNDVETIRAVAEFICRINYNLKLGHFDLDPSDGEIRYQATIPCLYGDSPSEEEIQSALGYAARVMDVFSPGFVGIVFHGEWPKNAYERCCQSS